MDLTYKWTIKYIMPSVVFSEIEHNFCNFRSRRDAINTAKRLKRLNPECRNVRVYEKETDDSTPALIYQID